MSVKSRPQKCRIGYARISTLQQDLTRQLQTLKSERCDKIFSDAASGKSRAGRPELEAALECLAPGDELVVAEWDRATRSMWDGMDIIKKVVDVGATIRVLDRSYIDLKTAMGRGFMAMFSALAEDERLRILKRTHEGRRVAQARGRKMGRREKLSESQKVEARKRLAAGRLPRELASHYKVSRATIARLRYSKEKA
jgi:DNA invertase Pin-like site-specific DNA recombinase